MQEILEILAGRPTPADGFELHRLMPVGALVQIQRASAINAAGEVGVVYERYDIAGVPGVSIIFEGGGHDGFSVHDIEAFGVLALTAPGNAHPLAKDYSFVSAVRLQRHFAAKRFDPCFADARILIAYISPGLH